MLNLVHVNGSYLITFSSIYISERGGGRGMPHKAWKSLELIKHIYLFNLLQNEKQVHIHG